VRKDFSLVAVEALPIDGAPVGGKSAFGGGGTGAPAAGAAAAGGGMLGPGGGGGVGVLLSKLMEALSSG